MSNCGGQPMGWRAAATFCACAGMVAMSGCAMMMQMRPAADSYTYDVGIASAPDARAKTSDILARLGYQVVTDDGYQGLYMQSQWKSRPPIDAQESTRGSEIISRVTMKGASRDVASAPTMYHVLLTVENRFVPLRGATREQRRLTASAGYAQSIVREMSLAFGGSGRPIADQPHP
jgi:hypothetical protein